MPPYVGLHFFYIRGLFLLSVPIEAVYAAFFSPCMALFGELKMRSSGRCINNNRGLSPRLPELQQNRFVELPNQRIMPLRQRELRQFRKFLTALATAYPSPMAESLLIFVRFSSMEE